MGSSINILQSAAWQLNERVLSVMEHLFDVEGGGVVGLPSKNEVVAPPDSDEYKMASIKKLNAEQHSLRCDLRLKLDLARKLVNEQHLYFPLNIDFRGRVYPISPHVNHIGSDTVRGLMLFAQPKRLGERGWFWLNVNLANKFGFDKVCNEERFRWALEHKHDILKVCDDPLKERWWMTADSPLCALSACLEIGNAYGHAQGVSEYHCRLPVGQDGSCNGLQHYAAMLRDDKMA